MTRASRCPTCAKAVENAAKAPHRPFCSERCKLIDLGRWLGEDYRIASYADPLDAFEAAEALGGPEGFEE